MKKIFLAVLSAFLLIFTSSRIIFADYKDQYRQIEKATNELSYGSKHYSILGESQSPRTTISEWGTGSTSMNNPDKFYQQKINVLEIPKSEDVLVVPWTNSSKNFGWSLSGLTGICANYEAKNPGYKVIGAINGDFFDMSGTGNNPYQPSGGHISLGQVLKASSSSRMVGFKNDGSLDSLVYLNDASHPDSKLDKSIMPYLYVYDESGREIYAKPLSKINEAPLSGETAVYYANWDNSKKIIPLQLPAGSFHKAVVKKAEKSLVNSDKDFYGLGVIDAVNNFNEALIDGQFAILSNNSETTNLLQKDVTVCIQYLFTHDGKKIDNAISGGASLLYDGEIEDRSNDELYKNRHPRTVIAKRKDGSILGIVIDGRSSESYGMTGEEMSALLKNLDCDFGFNLDGGGSSSLVLKEGGEFVTKNSPSDSSSRNIANGLLFVVKEPEFNLTFSERTQNSLKVKVDLVNNNDIVVNDMKVELSGEIKELINGYATFSGLTNNTAYNFIIHYKNASGIFVRTTGGATAYTTKRKPKINGLDITYNNNETNIKILLEDPDVAIREIYLIIDGETYTYNRFGVTLGEQIKAGKNGIIIQYSYNLNDDQPLQFEEYHISLEFAIENYLEKFIISRLK